MKMLGDEKGKYISLICGALCALLCAAGVWFVFGGESRDTLAFTLALAPAFYFFLKKAGQTALPGRLAASLCRVFAAFLALVLFLGKGIVAQAGLYKGIYSKLSLLCLAGLYLLTVSLLRFLLGLILQKEYALQKNGSDKKLFFGSWAGIFICWLPYLITQLPAVLDFDAIKQIKMINGVLPMTDQHPFAHTMLLKLCLILGGGSPTAYALVQMLLMSLMFAFAVTWMRSRGISKKWCVLTAAYFALNPVHASYSVSVRKDVLFGGFVLLLTLTLCEMYFTRGECLKKPAWVCLLAVSCLGTAFFRNNGPMMLAVLAIALIVAYRRYWKQTAAVLVCVFVLLGVVKGPVFAAMDVRPTNFTESLGIPLQQVARVVAQGGEITKEQTDTLEAFVSAETVKSNYNPYCVDYIKSEVYGADFHHDELNSRKGDFFRLWLELLPKNFKIYVESYLDSTYGYWYPLSESFVSYWNDVHQNELGLVRSTPSPRFTALLGSLAEKGWRLNVPSLCIYALVFFATAAWVKKGKRALLPFLPVLLLWLTVLVAAPIATSLRYVYHAFAAAPVLAAFCLLQPKPESEE